MRKVVLSAVRRIEYQEVPVPAATPGRVLVRLLRCGLCGTDVHNYYKETIFGKDRYPFHMGHETCGVVEAVGTGVQGLAKGDQVVINPFWTCGACEPCRLGHNNNCEHLNTIGLSGPSGYSEYTLPPAASVLKTLPDADPTLMAFTEPLGTIVYALEKLRLLPEHEVLIVGAGAIGMIAYQLLKTYPVRGITVADISEEKLAFARSLGAQRTLNTAAPDGGQRFDVIFDCTGVAKVAEWAVDRARFGGQVMIFGVCPIDSTITLRPFDIYKKDLTIAASMALNHAAFQRALHLIESGRVDLRPLVAGVYPVGRLEECIHWVKEGKVNGKIVIDTTRMA